MASAHAQKAQYSEDDKIMLSGTEMSIALRHEELRDLTLIHRPQDEAKEVLKAKVLPNINTSPRFTCSQSTKLHEEIFTNTCTCVTVHLSKDEDDIKRRSQKMEVEKIQTVCETVQAQISNLEVRDQEICGIHEKSGQDRWSLERVFVA